VYEVSENYLLKFYKFPFYIASLTVTSKTTLSDIHTGMTSDEWLQWLNFIIDNANKLYYICRSDFLQLDIGF